MAESITSFLKTNWALRKATQELLSKMDESELDDLYQKVLDIELAETPDSGKMSSRGETAVEIVNIMAVALGIQPKDAYDEFLADMED